jgi:predicted DNA-binding transcriptional regulator AlpA
MTCTMYFPAPSHSGDGLPKMLNAQLMSELTGYAKRSIRRFKATGRIPPPNPLGLWQRDEIESWLAHGAPVADVWVEIRPKRFQH